MLMFALYRAQSRGEALAAYTDARDTLVAELGIEPGRPLRRLHKAVLTDDPLLLGGAGEWLTGG
jgi:DNA-binding SARP family transcriptional activator